MHTKHFTFKQLRFGLLSLFIVLMISCSQQEQERPSNEQQASGGQRQLTIGLIPEQDLFAQKKRYEPLFTYLSQELGLPINIKILSRYDNILTNFSDLDLDGAFFGSLTGALAVTRLKVEPLVRPQHPSGASTYYGMVFVKRGSNIRTADDMRHKRMVFVDKATTAGYLLPLAYFKSLGIDNYQDWFSEYYFSGTHEDAIKDVLNGQADIGAAKNTIFYQMASLDERVLKDLEILTTSPHVPANGLAVRNDLPDDLKQRLKQILVNLHITSDGRRVLNTLNFEKFIETTVDDYQPVLDYAASIDFDLSTYNYLNN